MQQGLQPDSVHLAVAIQEHQNVPWGGKNRLMLVRAGETWNHPHPSGMQRRPAEHAPVFALKETGNTDFLMSKKVGCQVLRVFRGSWPTGLEAGLGKILRKQVELSWASIF